MFSIPFRLSAHAGASAALVVFAVLLPGEAGAQDVPDRLSLDQAIEIGLLNNPGFLAVENDVDAADAQVRSSYWQLAPTVSLGTSVTSQYRETETAFGNFGEPLSQPRALITRTSYNSQSVNVGSVTLFDGGRQFRDIRIAKLRRTSAAANIALQRNTLTASITRAYFQAVNAEARVALEQRLLGFAQSRLALVREQFRLAVVRQTDLLGAEGEVWQREDALFTAESDARRQRLALLEVLGVRGEPAFALTSEIPTPIDPATLDVDALVARALSGHPSIIQRNAALDLADKQAANQRSFRLPQVTLRLPSYSWGATESGLFDAWGKFGAPNNTFTFGISASLPLFTGFSTSAQIAQSRADAEDARYQARLTRLQVEGDVRSAVIDLEQAFHSLRLAEQLAESSQRRLELGQEEYRVGASNYTSLQQIVQANDQAQRGVIQARFSFLSARVALEERVGGPLQTTAGGD